MLVMLVLLLTVCEVNTSGILSTNPTPLIGLKFAVRAKSIAFLQEIFSLLGDENISKHVHIRYSLNRIQFNWIDYSLIINLFYVCLFND